MDTYWYDSKSIAGVPMGQALPGHSITAHSMSVTLIGTFSAVGSAKGCLSLGRRFDSVYRPYHVTRSFVVHIGFPVRVWITPH